MVCARRRRLTIGPVRDGGIDEALAVDDDAIEARARADARELFVDRTREYRGARSSFLVSLGYLGFGLLPAIPGGAELFGVGWEVTLGFMGAQTANTIVGVPVLARHHPLSAPAIAVELIGTCTWIGGAVAMIALSGSAKSLFWFNLGTIVVLVVHTIHHHARVFYPLVIGIAALVAWFALAGQWSDAALSLVFGFGLCLFQRMSTSYGWRLARAEARARLVAEKAAALLVAEERKRIERELHDGVAAELTAALWHARSLESAGHGRATELAHGIRKSLVELRRVIANIRDEPTTLGALGARIREVAASLAGSRAALEVEVEVERPEAVLDPERSTHLVRVLQESLRNALDRGGARAVRVSFVASSEGSLSLVIEDDGAGFDPAAPMVEGGLDNLRARAARLGGEIVWAPRLEGGTRVTLCVPPG